MTSRALEHKNGALPLVHHSPPEAQLPHLHAAAENVDRAMVELDLTEDAELNDMLHEKALPAWIGDFRSLRTLSVRCCKGLAALPPSIGQLEQLKTLDLEGCWCLCVLPYSIGALKALETLNVGCCNSLQLVPESLGQLVALQSLSFAHCGGLLALPSSLGNLCALRTLNLQECSKLLTLPDSIGDLCSLRSLNLKLCDQLLELPEQIDQLAELEFLDVSYCLNLTAFPQTSFKLCHASLRTLKMYDCPAADALPEPPDDAWATPRLVAAVQTLRIGHPRRRRQSGERRSAPPRWGLVKQLVKILGRPRRETDDVQVAPA